MRKFLSTVLTTLLIFGQVHAASDLRVVEGDVLASQYGFRNLVKNPNCKKNVANITIGGGAVVTKNTTSPLDGISDCKLASGTVSTATFETYALPEELKGQNCEARIMYRTPGSGATNFLVYSGATLIATAPYAISSTTKESSVNFPCGDGSSALKLTAGGLAYGDTYMSVYIGKATNLTSEYNNAPTSWTPTGSWSTNTTYTGKRQITNRGTVVYDVLVTTGGLPTATTLEINLPPGDVIDTTRLNVSTANNYNLDGTVVAFDNGGSAYALGSLRYSSTTSFSVGTQNASGTYGTYTSITQAVPFTFGIGDTVNAHVELPIVGIASQTAFKQDCALDGSCINTFSAEIDTASSCAVSKENVDWITSTSSGGPGICTMTFKSGLFSVAPVCIANGVYYPMGHGINTGDLTSSSVTIRSYNYSTGVNTATTQRLVCFRASTDVKPNINAPILVGSVTSDSTGAERFERLRFTGGTANQVCSSSPCTIFSQSGSWVSTVTRSGTGLYTINLAAGKFTSAPDCTCSAYDNGRICTIQGTSTSTVGIGSHDSTGAASDQPISVHCMGPR